MEDQFQFAESLDNRTMEYVARELERFNSEFGNTDDALLREISGYIYARKVMQAITEGSHLVLLFSEEKEHVVSVDGKVIYRTDKVLLWISSSRDSTRIGVFESEGSDLGTLRIFHNGNEVEQVRGKITQIVFTESSYYLVKTFSEEPPEDGGEINSHRILSDGKIVFGSGLGSTDFIHLHRSGNTAIIEVGNWVRSAIYTGTFEDPVTWKKLREFDSPVLPLGIVENKLAYVEKTGKGRLCVGDAVMIEPELAIENAVIVSNGFLVLLLEDAKIKPVLYDASGKIIREYALNGPMGLLDLHSDEKSAVLILHSFGIPFALYRQHDSELEMIERNVLLETKTEERFSDSSGVKIHYFLVNSSVPGEKNAMAYGYGGFNISVTPGFQPLFAALLSHGVTIAVSTLRGGGEYGEEWHMAGVRERKQNVFNDFISVIEDLRNQGYSVVAEGRSNGGLLVGSVLTQRPDILSGAVIGVPVLDMLRFHRLSVGKYWTTEYGNPDNENDAAFLKEYSPYHNIAGADYPYTLIFSRMKDDRVHPAHAIKFQMKLSKFTGKSYLRIRQGGGHAGITPYEEAVETTENVNFILRCFSGRK